jgi:hypothetical protein
MFIKICFKCIILNSGNSQRKLNEINYLRTWKKIRV